MDIDPIIPPPDDDFEPSQPRPRGGLRRFFLPVVGGATVVVALLCLAARWSPAFYRDRLPPGGPLAGRAPAAAAAAAEQAARRLVTAASAWHADFLRVGRWEAVFDERDINGWLATDLPRNHAAALPAAASAPRVEFVPGGLRAGVTVGRGPLVAVVWIEAEVSLRAANQVGIALVAARAGSLPLPHAPLLRQLAGRLERLGVVTEIRRQGDRGLLLVYIPSTHQAGGFSHWLESMRFAAGEVAVAGETRRGAVRPPSEP